METSALILAFAMSIVLSTIVAVVIVPPTRSVLRELCPTGDGVAFWTRFTLLMLYLGPLIVTLTFGVPDGNYALRLSAAEQVLRVISAALVGAFLTLGGIGLRIGTLRRSAVSAPPRRKTDDEFIR